jgi:hypothetical protein
MRQETINIYKIDELSEKSRRIALDKLREYNLNYNWWDYIYDDAKNINLEIKGFDINAYIDMEFIYTAEETADAIIKNHGDMCDTYQHAKNFLNGNYYRDDNEFLIDLKIDYLNMLAKEYDYLQSDEAILELCDANSYEFYENGRML